MPVVRGARAGSSPRGRGKPDLRAPNFLGTRLIPAWAGKTSPLSADAHMIPAHPRVGGENRYPRTGMRSYAGSSPRGRGKPALSMSFRIPIGLIPAWAGKTGTMPGSTRMVRAHPRVGGENARMQRSASKARGSSPRGRGKPRQPRRPSRVDRLIPAWAGKTARAASSPSTSPAHPRVGGENPKSSRISRSAFGSSPRGRGKPTHSRSSRRPRRLIPAWAGKTDRQDVIWLGAVAHPRVGGENAQRESSDQTRRGSSPRGRGKLTCQTPDTTVERLIPAWAGKTSRPPCLSSSNGAHPRVGGENPRAQEGRRTVKGSSPRGRGKREVKEDVNVPGRLIPAWAGKTASGRGWRSHRRAHPRVGGENTVEMPCQMVSQGSSPRGRGKRRRQEAPNVHDVAHPRVGGENTPKEPL